jgi:hypothetical protein
MRYNAVFGVELTSLMLILRVVSKVGGSELD